MTNQESTAVAVLTPAGRGAVASLALVGPAAAAIVAECFAPRAGRTLEELPIDRIVFGRWTQPPAAGEEVVVARRGSGRIELHCHGGEAVSQALIETLIARGCRRQDAFVLTELTTQPNTEAPPDELRLEARHALAQAATQRTAAILLDQWRGALRDEVNAIRALLEAKDFVATLQRLSALLRAGDLGEHLTQPFHVVLAGRPNVGKSSLINALLGYGRAIVFEQPGTTRDVLTAVTAVDGWPIELSDTAGLRAGDDEIEVAGVERARRRIAAADLVVAVFDGAQSWSAADQELLQFVGAPLLVFNKSDLCRTSPDDGRPVGLMISALTGEGLSWLLEDVARRLVPKPPTPGVPVPFTSRQTDLLRGAQAAVRSGDFNEAQRMLGQL